MIAIQLLVVVYLGTYLALNAPAYFKQARFTARGSDLSSELAGQFLPLESLSASLAGADFPGIEIELSPNVSMLPTTSGQTEPPKPVIPYVDPDVFVPYTVTVPRIGVRAPLVKIDVNTDKAQQSGLAQGVIHIPDTPEPGELGNAFYAGHSSDYLFKSGAYKTVFALLPNLVKGDYFILTSDSKAYYYTVNETVVTSPNDTSVMTRGGGKEKLASLQTSYPVGTARQRFVVVGKLSGVVDASKLKR